MCKEFCHTILIIKNTNIDQIDDIIHYTILIIENTNIDQNQNYKCHRCILNKENRIKPILVYQKNGPSTIRDSPEIYCCKY